MSKSGIDGLVDGVEEVVNDINVVASAAGHHVGVAAAVEQVRRRIAGERVRPVRSEQILDPGQGIESRPVGVLTHGDGKIDGHTARRARIGGGVALGSSVETIVPGPALQEVVARIAFQQIVAGHADERVVAILALQMIIRRTAIGDVVVDRSGIVVRGEEAVDRGTFGGRPDSVRGDRGEAGADRVVELDSEAFRPLGEGVQRDVEGNEGLHLARDEHDRSARQLPAEICRADRVRSGRHEPPGDASRRADVAEAHHREAGRATVRLGHFGELALPHVEGKNV